jgi:hypothetical protein
MADLVGSVTREIEALPPAVALSGLAATTITLAERLEVASPRDAAPLGRELRESLAKLQAMANESATEEVDPLDKLLGGRPHLRVAGA